jgi:hypothetical protein
MFTYLGTGTFRDRQNNPKYIKLATKHVFANVSRNRDIDDAKAKSVNEVAVSVRAVSQSFSDWPALFDFNMNLEPKRSPHRTRAKTRKNISFEYFMAQILLFE